MSSGKLKAKNGSYVLIKINSFTFSLLISFLRELNKTLSFNFCKPLYHLPLGRKFMGKVTGGVTIVTLEFSPVLKLFLLLTQSNNDFNSLYIIYDIKCVNY